MCQYIISTFFQKVFRGWVTSPRPGDGSPFVGRDPARTSLAGVPAFAADFFEVVADGIVHTPHIPSQSFPNPSNVCWPRSWSVDRSTLVIGWHDLCKNSPRGKRISSTLAMRSES